MNKARILAVDDEIGIRMSIEESLEERYEVITAESGEDAIKEFQKEKPSLVLLDMRLPGMNGVETLKRIKELDKSVPVVMLSVIDNIKSVVEAMKAGAENYFNKPFNAEQISFNVSSTLEQCGRPGPGTLEAIGTMTDDISGRLVEQECGLKSAVKTFKKEYIRSMLKVSAGDIEKAAEFMGVTTGTVKSAI